MFSGDVYSLLRRPDVTAPHVGAAHERGRRAEGPADDGHRSPRDLPEDAKNAMLGQIALGRLGEPADIARAVAFLAGPDAGYITGANLPVNGGLFISF